MYRNDPRIVMTLDAGGTNFVFSATQGYQQIVTPITYGSNAGDLNKCLNTLVEGFTQVLNQLEQAPIAISFAFPGPADYPNGIIGDLPNFPSFRGGIPLKAYLESKFNIPVFINNDGDLFAFGESIAGALPQINSILEKSGSQRRYKNLIGVTLGTGFGAGVVTAGKLHLGDNSDGGNLWSNRNKKYPNLIIEESVSIRAVKRVYAELSGDSTELTPKDIFDMAEGSKPGNREAAIQSFAELGEMAGDALAATLNLIDGIVVIGGGLAGAEKYIIPAMIQEMNGLTGTFAGDHFPRMSVKAIDLQRNLEEFINLPAKRIKVPQTEIEVDYYPNKITGVMISSLGASRAISIGAYAYALEQIENQTAK
ncbi:MAG: ROK family protein [Phocaeicola sp.]